MQWPKRFGLPTTNDVVALGNAIADMRRRVPRAEVATALFVAPLEACLSVKETDRPEDMKQVVAQVLTASAQIPSLDVGSVRNANPWVSADDIGLFMKALGVSDLAEPVAPEAFALPGRPAAVRTHLSLEKDAPVSRAVERAGRILCRPILGGLHHQYARF
jgi:cell division protease FtsH